MIDETLLSSLEQYLDTNRIQEIVNQIDEANNTKIVATLVEELQTMNNKLYEKQGLTNETLDFQCYINTLRNQYDITDPREIIHTDNGKGFVQWNT